MGILGRSEEDIECEQNKETGQLLCTVKDGEKIKGKVLFQVSPDGKMRPVKIKGSPGSIDRLIDYIKDKVVIDVKRKGEF